MRLFFSLLILLSFFSRATEPVQVFTDDLGRKVTVPAHPKRIVSLHDLDITIPLIELGVPPVASHGRTRPDGSHFIRSGALLTGVDFDNSSIAFIGTADIDIEAIVAAKPDLIITEPTRNTPIEQLEKIAPTVSIDHLKGGAPEIYRKLAELTGTQSQLAILERRYQAQINALKATLDSQKITVSVIQANQGKINVQLDVKIILMNNEALGLVHQQQSLFYKQGVFAATYPGKINFMQIAAGFGLETCDLNNEADPQAALQEIINRPGPALIHVRIDAEEKVYPMVPPGAANTEMVGE